MNSTVLLCLLFMKITYLHARSALHKQQLRTYPERQNNLLESGIIDIPVEPEDYPEAEAIAPGHTLLQPSLDMLASAVKFPQKEDERLVYGNLDNLGTTHGKINERILYTSFRRLNNILNMILTTGVMTKQSSDSWRHLQMVAMTDDNGRMSGLAVEVYIRGNHRNVENVESEYDLKVAEDEDNASEILDNVDSFGEFNEAQDFRRKRSSTHKYRERESSESTDSDSSSSSGSSDYERNPGNPYSVFKDKYMQNWMWNHHMDGDHMNVNPYAPTFNTLGPSGAALFFNRKWWYYNQDDYRPFD